MMLKPYTSTYLLSGAKSSKEIVKYPEDFATDTYFDVTQKIITSKYVSAKFKRYLFDGVRLELGEVNLKKDLRIEVSHNFPFLKMHFEIEGSSSYFPNNKKSFPVIIPNGHHQLFFFPKVDGVLSYPANITRKTLEINLSLSFIHKVFKDDWTILEELGDAIQKNKPFLFSSESNVINSEIQLVIQQIVSCKVDDQYKKTYLENKIIELLILQLHDFKLNAKNHIPRLRDEKIVDAKSFIDENIYTKITIASISKNIGMNIQDLKREFKLKFGTTIFKYVTTKRMEIAFKMLKTTDKSIYEIANIVGYRYSQHFAKAFKKYYGVNPSYYRKSCYLKIAKA